MEDEAGRRSAPTNRRTRQARERFLRAALEVWAELDAADGLAAVSPRRVARRAERHTGALYHHWPRIDLFHRDLLQWALDAERHAALDDVAGDILAAGDRTHPTEEIAGLAQWSFERTVLDQRAEFRFLVAAAALADGDREVAAAVRANYRAILGRNAVLYEELLSRWGRQVREPLDAGDLATVLAALSDGMALRHLVEPDAATPELFVAAVTAVLPALSRPTASPVPLEAFVRQLLARPVDEEALREGRIRGERAAVALYREGGWDAVTVAAVAGRARLEPLVVQRTFGGRDGLAVPVWAAVLLPPLRVAGEAALHAGGGLDALVAYLRELVTVAHGHRAVTAALLATVQAATAQGPPAGPDDPRSLVPIMDIPQRAGVAAYDQGTLDRELVADREAAADLAAFATNFLLLRFLTRPAEAPGRTAELVERLVIDGLRAKT